MCGRAAQTVRTANAAAHAFGAPHDGASCGRRADTSQSEISFSKTSSNGGNDNYGQRDNYNMSPGMDAAVLWMEDGKLRTDQKIWGLVTKGGSSQNPLPSDSKSRMGMHFSGLMYNARTDTLFAKPTFSRLAKKKRSCVVALDGYFEWKASPLAGGKGKKQPYFVHRREEADTNSGTPTLPSYLLMAGLWTQVPTGLSSEPFLDTFTILTTESCKQIEWLHHRMPVCVWDIALARKWLENPSPTTHKELDLAAKRNNEGFVWHMVTTEMSSVKFRAEEAVHPKKGPTPVTAFFTKQPSSAATSIQHPSQGVAKQSDHPRDNGQRFVSVPSALNLPKSVTLKRDASLKTKGRSPKKARTTTDLESPNKGLITSFFQKKS